MAAITNTQITSVPRSATELHVSFVFTIDNRDIFTVGPRFYANSDDLDAAGAGVGVALLESLAQQEIDTWLST